MTRKNLNLARPTNEILKDMNLGRSETRSTANEGEGRPSDTVTSEARRGADDGILVVPLRESVRIEK